MARRTYEAFGAYVRSQRQLAQLSLRQAALLEPLRVVSGDV